jgi:hypothetical protein
MCLGTGWLHLYGIIRVRMKVSTAIKFLSELDENQIIYIQWYDKNDMSKMGVNGEEVIPKDVWKLAVEIAENYESTDLYTDLEQSIDEAYEQLNLTKAE